MNRIDASRSIAKAPLQPWERSHLQQELKRTESAIKRLVTAYEEDLVSLVELRQRMPELRRRQKTVSREIESLDDRLANEEIYLKLAENLESFLARLQNTYAHSSVLERQQIVRLVIREVLVDTDAVVIRHTIPGLDPEGKPQLPFVGKESWRRFILRTRLGKFWSASGFPHVRRL